MTSAAQSPTLEKSTQTCRARTAWYLSVALVLAVAWLGPARQASAAEFSAPVVVEQPPAAWPNDEPGPRDVIVPVVLVVAPSGKVESVEVEASLGADFDDAARAAASSHAESGAIPFFTAAQVDERTLVTDAMNTPACFEQR